VRHLDLRQPEPSMERRTRTERPLDVGNVAPDVSSLRKLRFGSIDTGALKHQTRQRNQTSSVRGSASNRRDFPIIQEFVRRRLIQQRRLTDCATISPSAGG
jgi:hypothetical protein